MPVTIVVTTTVTITAVIPIAAVVIAIGIAAVAEGEDFGDSHILFLLCTGESLFPEGS
jgi:hypothetical protein